MTSIVIRGNALGLPLADNSVDLICTSPPYFGLRSYQDGGEHYSGQLGSEPTPADFVAALVAATREMVRVLKPSGSIFVNLGDKYMSRQFGYGATDGGSWAKVHGETGDTRENGKPIEGRRGGEGISKSGHMSEVSGVPRKSLMLIPERYRIACVDELGLIARAVIVWDKPNGLPESVRDRVRRSHEDWVHFTKMPRYYSAVDEIREGYSPASNERAAYGFETAAKGRHLGSPVDTRSAATPGWQPNVLGKLPGSVWRIATQPLKVPAELGIDHFAAFPMEWPRRIIKGWSPREVCTACGEGRAPVSEKAAALRVRGDAGDGGRGTRGLPGYSDIDRKGWQEGVTYVVTGYACACPDTTAPTTPGVVLDPFGGTGTTALMADVLGMTGISVDMSGDYCRLAQWRTTDPKQRERALRKPGEKTSKAPKAPKASKVAVQGVLWDDPKA